MRRRGTSRRSNANDSFGGPGYDLAVAADLLTNTRQPQRGALSGKEYEDHQKWLKELAEKRLNANKPKQG